MSSRANTHSMMSSRTMPPATPAARGTTEEEEGEVEDEGEEGEAEEEGKGVEDEGVVVAAVGEKV